MIKILFLEHGFFHKTMSSKTYQYISKCLNNPLYDYKEGDFKIDVDELIRAATKIVIHNI